MQGTLGSACNLTPDGGGSSHTTTAIATLMPRFFMSAPHLKGFSAGAGADAAAADTTAVLALTQSRCARRDCLRESDGCAMLCTRDGLPTPRLMDGAAAGGDANGHDATWRARACALTGANAPAVQADIMLQILAERLQAACIKPHWALRSQSWLQECRPALSFPSLPSQNAAKQCGALPCALTHRIVTI